MAWVITFTCVFTGLPAPDHDEVRLLHLAGIDAGNLAGPGKYPVQDRVTQMLSYMPEYFLAWRRRSNPIAHHQTHGARIVIGPDGFGAIVGFGFEECAAVSSIASSQLMRLNGPALGANALQRVQQAIGMVNALGIAAHFFADHAEGVGIVLGAAHPADMARIQQFHLKGAGRRAIMGTGANGPCGAGQVCSCDIHSANSGSHNAAFCLGDKLDACILA